MCEIRKGNLYNPQMVNISSANTMITNSETRLGSLADSRMNSLIRLECRHLDSAKPKWEPIPWPKDDEVVILPPLTEIRIMGRSPRKARKFNRLFQNADENKGG